MPDRRLLIVPRFQRQGLIGCATFAGLAAGSAYSVPLWFTLRMEPPGVIGVLLLLVVQLALPLLLGLAFATWVAVLSPRRLSIVMLSVVFWMAMALGVSVAFDFKEVGEQNTGHHLTSLKWWIPQSLFVLFCGLAGCIVGGLVDLVAHAACTRHEQDGLWCWKCAYRIGEVTIAACPECGSPKNPSRFRFAILIRALSFGRRIGWIGVATWVLVALSFVAATDSATDESVARHGLEKLGKAQGGYLCLLGSSPLSFGPNCQSVSIPLNPAASLDLLVAYRPIPRPGEPVVQLQVSQVLRRSTWLLGSSMSSSIPIPRVLCDLDEKQTAYLIDNGVPQSLKAAMLAASAGGTIGWSGTAPPPPDIRIDPAPHFPPP